MNLVSSLKEMSRRWQGKYAQDSQKLRKLNTEESDLAAKYAGDLLKMHEDAQQEANFCSRVLGYKSGSINTIASTQLPRSECTQAASGLSQGRASLAQLQTTSPTAMTSQIPTSISTRHELPLSNILQPSPQTHITTPSPTTGRPMLRPPSMSHTFNNLPFEHFPQNDELTAISHTLLGNEFMELDRIITLDGTDFSLDIGTWPTYLGPQVFD